MAFPTKAFVPNIASPNWWKRTAKEVKLAWSLLRDPDVPKHVKIIPALVLAYLLLPFDLIPGFLPIIGQLDDTAIMLLGVKAFVYLAPNDVVARYQPQLTT